MRPSTRRGPPANSHPRARSYARLLNNLAAVVTAAGIVTFGTSASACIFDGTMGRMGGAHPKSIDVAFAISDAMDKGILERAGSTLQGQEGYWRAVGRLAQFQQFFPHHDSSNLSFLLVDSQLWVRFKHSAAGYSLIPHTDGPDQGDVVVLTGEPVLARILDGKLRTDEALDLGLIVVSGDSAAASELASAMALRRDGLSPRHAPMTFLPPARVRSGQ